MQQPNRHQRPGQVQLAADGLSSIVFPPLLCCFILIFTDTYQETDNLYFMFIRQHF